MLPTTETAKRLAALFNRRLTTPWSEKEIRSYKTLMKLNSISIPDIDLLGRYYAVERKKGEKGIHRRDLSTLLNNFPSELDRATLWDLNNKCARERSKSVINTNGQMEKTSDSDWQRISEKAKIELERLKNQFHGDKIGDMSGGERRT